jgi:diaminopropionate ammonia-lyase family
MVPIACNRSIQLQAPPATPARHNAGAMATIFPNPNARRGPYPPELARILDIARARECRQWLAQWDMLSPRPTPLRALPALAARMAVAQVALKDESVRSPLGSFKALGAPAALIRLVMGRLPAAGADPQGVLAGRFADALAGLVVASATDGNHGRALAAAARSAGCGCVIVLHAHVSEEREAAIAALGARIVRVAGDYDDSVREADRLARENGWQVVSDTSYPGYETVPRDVMQGYAVIADELREQQALPFTHVFLQGGVGGLAAGVAAYLWEQWRAARPAIVVVEPAQADCLLQSARAGAPARASGSVDSVMAGLACGEASPLAWRFLREAGDLFMTVSDAQAIEAMRHLAQGRGGDVPVVAGESGAAGAAALLAAQDAASRQALGLDAHSRVLLLNTEGATAPALYASLVGEEAAQVLRRQAAWRP